MTRSNGTDDRDERTSNSSSTGVRSARRALEILSLLQESRPTLSTKEAVEETGLPRTTVLRLLETLEECGLVWPTASHTYVAGPSLLRWTGMAAKAWQLPANTRELMAEVARESGETVNIHVRYGVHRVCIASVEGSQALRYVVRVGSEQPLWAGVPAKILLIDAPDRVLARVAAASPHGPAHLETLRTWREQAIRHGFAVSHSEREDGLSALGVPIRGRSGQVLATVALAGPTARFTEDRIPGFRAALNRIARHLEEAGFEHAPGIPRPGE